MKRRYQYPELEIEMLETNIIRTSTLTYEEEDPGADGGEL